MVEDRIQINQKEKLLIYNQDMPTLVLETIQEIEFKFYYLINKIIT